MRLLYSTFGKVPDPDVIEDLCPEYFDRTITATVFTGMVLEALLYDYASVKRSKSYADKVSFKTLENEFIAIAKDLLQLAGPREKELSERLTGFRKVRKYFVHNKSSEPGKGVNYNLDFLSPDGCVQLLIDVAEYFYSHDKEYVLFSVCLDSLKGLQQTERGF
jgi:hypothetical protein